MVNLISHGKMMQALDWAYDRAVNGIGAFSSAENLAESYQKSGKTPFEQANSLIRYQNAKAATSGFVTGLGGLITLPIAIPANIASVLYVQIRMIAAIAHIGGHDIRDDRVKTMVYTCLAASSVKDVVKDFGVSVTNKVGLNLVKAIPGKTLTAINRKVGFRLVTKTGQTGFINLTKTVPVLGGVFGASFDATLTNKVGKIARDAFVGRDSPPIIFAPVETY